ncbi:hypothetical protein HW115_15980 [Verrucomicrobiaceae bacterium N1E253]|uniref:Uncharacterized protein n=1 Tax=Oceaniferula marina TaxID=2748318 RepID=A0A851GMQ5_9BACT|nr:hypothetical protein [Oceaniferula marina]NWK57121.1 hypothetical protein [Oceaniferula marina]
MILLVTAYGRCVTDQFGIFGPSQSVCCQLTCHEEQAEEQDAATPQQGSLAHHDHDHTHDHSHAPGDAPCSPTEDNEPKPEENPCQLCFILDSDSMLPSQDLKVPSPSLTDLCGLQWISPFDGILPNGGPPAESQNRPPTNFPDDTDEQDSQLKQQHRKNTPVRGPSLV